MVIPSFYPIKGGAEAVVRSLSIKLNEIGIHTDIMTFNMNRKWNPFWQAKIEEIDGVNVFKIPALNWFPLEHSDRITMGINLIPGRFRNHLKKYDIIHFHGKDLTFPLFSYMIKKPKIFHSHGFSVDFYKRYFLSKLIFKHIADQYISISEHMTKELVELGIPQNKISYLPNGVDVNLFCPSGKKEDNLILFVGRVTFGKGLHVLLNSLTYLKESTHLVIIGPPAWDVKYFEKTMKQIDAINKKGVHKISYLGPKDKAEIAKWYQKATVFVLPSFTEAFPVVNLEALSCATPVVATNVGGIPEVVRNGENGILVPPNDVTKLAEALQYLLDNKKVRTKFGHEGRNWIMKHFSLDSVTEKACKIYQKTICC